MQSTRHDNGAMNKPQPTGHKSERKYTGPSTKHFLRFVVLWPSMLLRKLVLTLGGDGVHLRAERVRLQERVRDHLAEVAADVALHHLQQAALVLSFSIPRR